MKIIIMINKKYFWKNIHINNIKMLYYDRIDVSGSVDINKTIASKIDIFQIQGLSFKQLPAMGAMMY